MVSTLLFAASGGSIIDLDGTFFIQMAIYLAMFIFLQMAVFRPVVRILDARKSVTDGMEERAKELISEADAIVADFEQRVNVAKKELAEKQRRIIREAEAKERAIIRRAEEYARHHLDESLQKMERSVLDARAYLNKRVEPMVDVLVDKLTTGKGPHG
jgi:F-type H+-transporting ATPase subunit b